MKGKLIKSVACLALVVSCLLTGGMGVVAEGKSR